MTVWSLVAAHLLRNPTRLVLSSLSLLVAFLLLILLQSISARFASGADQTDTILVSRAKHLSAYMLPETHVDLIRGVDGVVAVTPVLGFGAYYQDPRNSFDSLAVYPEQIMATVDNMDLDEAAQARFERIRIGVVISEPLAERFGWQVGDAITLRSGIYPLETGDDAWPFEIVGIAQGRDGRYVPPVLFLSHIYFSEAGRINKHRANFFQVRIDRPSNVSRAMREIDTATGITPQPTQTFSQDYLSRTNARQLGDIGRITTLILGAVFFSVLLVTGHGAVHSVRQRFPELAVMRTLGFSSRGLATLVLMEHALLCLACCALAVLIANLLEYAFNSQLATYVGDFDISIESAAVASGTALLTAVVISVVPVFELTRLDVVRALRPD